MATPLTLSPGEPKTVQTKHKCTPQISKFIQFMYSTSICVELDTWIERAKELTRWRICIANQLTFDVHKHRIHVIIKLRTTEANQESRTINILAIKGLGSCSNPHQVCSDMDNALSKWDQSTLFVFGFT
eukprot:m.55546 g.55546  ORF g.55546 m.55546 type:complete len:129 (-) comp22098_c0_seq1:1089-1475(-)